MLRIFLLCGLILHKAVWEVLKRRDPASRPKVHLPFAVRLVKFVKIAILAGILAQTLLPVAVLPMLPAPSVAQLACGVMLYVLGLAIALTARIQLGGNWSDIEAGEMKEHHLVVSTGLYRYVRHPIYTGDLLLLAGLELALNSWLVLGVPVLAVVVFVKAAGEERTLARAFPDYVLYLRRTKRFVPFVL